ncbi:hypothetical protein GCM10009798_42370 [Nocardioides panacihumi]|uniref:Uncharacterized protein n=1 Tax=Nocardioides panacihumi TaxID=400774 RepID=A0ABN2RXP6_9ACTN
MVDPPDRVCLPVEMEFIPLYRESGWSARLRREQKREQRRLRRLSAKRARRTPTGYWPRMTMTPTGPDDPQTMPDHNDPIEPGQEPGPGAEPEPDDSTAT